MKKLTKISLALIILLLIGGCDTMYSTETAHSKLIGLTREQLLLPAEGTKVETNVLSSLKFIQKTTENRKYQLVFDATRNVCRIYAEKTETLHFDDGSESSEYVARYFLYPVLSLVQGNSVSLDFTSYISFFENLSLEKFVAWQRSEFQQQYDSTKKMYDATTDAEEKAKILKLMEQWKNSIKQCSSVESYKKEDKTLAYYENVKAYFNAESQAIKAINPVTGIISLDKKTITFNKIFIGLDSDKKPEYAENVVFTKQ